MAADDGAPSSPAGAWVPFGILIAERLEQRRAAAAEQPLAPAAHEPVEQIPAEAREAALGAPDGGGGAPLPGEPSIVVSAVFLTLTTIGAFVAAKSTLKVTYWTAKTLF
ncbi:hypothetical protein HK405_000804, partial [Cladochytrium tenue]